MGHRRGDGLVRGVPHGVDLPPHGMPGRRGPVHRQQEWPVGRVGLGQLPGDLKAGSETRPQRALDDAEGPVAQRHRRLQTVPLLGVGGVEAHRGHQLGPQPECGRHHQVATQRVAHERHRTGAGHRRDHLYQVVAQGAKVGRISPAPGAGRVAGPVVGQDLVAPLNQAGAHPGPVVEGPAEPRLQHHQRAIRCRAGDGVGQGAPPAGDVAAQLRLDLGEPSAVGHGRGACGGHRADGEGGGGPGQQVRPVVPVGRADVEHRGVQAGEGQEEPAEAHGVGVGGVEEPADHDVGAGEAVSGHQQQRQRQLPHHHPLRGAARQRRPGLQRTPQAPVAVGLGPEDARQGIAAGPGGAGQLGRPGGQVVEARLEGQEPQGGVTDHRVVGHPGGGGGRVQQQSHLVGAVEAAGFDLHHHARGKGQVSARHQAHPPPAGQQEGAGGGDAAQVEGPRPAPRGQVREEAALLARAVGDRRVVEAVPLQLRPS